MTRATHFIGGTLYTPNGFISSELLVVAGLITAIGPELEVPTETTVVDLDGGTLLPAFGDGHAHPLQAGLAAQFMPVTDIDLPQLYETLRAWDHEHPRTGDPNDDWIQGWGFDLSLTPDGLFDARWLDAIVADRPVMLRGTDYHSLWCNTEALRRSGLTAQSPDPGLGEMPRLADGSPLGTLREWGATAPIFAARPSISPQQHARAIRHASAVYAALGVTWVQDAWVETSDLPAYLAAARSGDLRIRVNLAFLAGPENWRTDLEDAVAQRNTVNELNSAMLTGNTVKFFADGVIESGTAALLAPYVDCPHSHGIPNWTASELAKAVKAYAAQGFQIHIHAIGDAGIRDSLDALAGARHTTMAPNARPVIAHAQLINPADLPRFAELRVIACFQPLWATADASQLVLTTPRLGAERAALQYPMAGIIKSGAPISFGSDWPVSSPDPLLGIATAVTRQLPSGEPAGGWLPAERLTITQALDAYTQGSAYQGFRDDAGILAVGAVADLVWLSAGLDDTTLADMNTFGIAAAGVKGTWLAGSRIYTA